MITCPRCGAENKDNATVCRMCATALDPASAGAPPRPAGMPQDIPATVLVPSPGAPQQAGPAPGGKVMCPGCQASNDADWAFCQQCGTRLQAAPQPAAGPQPPAWGAPTVVTPAQPPPEQQQWGAPTVIAPAPDFSQPPQPPPPPNNMPPAWGAPTVVTPAAPPQPPQAPVWGAPTVVTPAPDFAQMQQQQQQQQPPPPPPPPQPQAPVWGAPTVVTPVPPDMMQPPMGNPPPGDQRYVQTVVGSNAQEIDSYPETIVTPTAPPSAPAPPPSSGSGTEPIGDAAPAPQPPRASEPAPEQPSAGGGPTSDMARPPMPPPAMPPGGQSTIVMSSTPVASPPKPAKLLLIMEGGEVGETFGLRPAETVIGRVDGDIKFPHDGYMSSRHARILQRNGRFFLIDNNSRNGTFVKIHQEVELHPGDVILVGKQLFRFETDE